MLDVCLLGAGGMMPLPKRALTALMTRYNGSSLLIDCGEGTQVSIREQDGVFIPLIQSVLRIFMGITSVVCRGFYCRWEMRNGASQS